MSDTITVFKSDLQRIENHIVRLEHMIVLILDEMHGFHGKQQDEEAREDLSRFLNDVHQTVPDVPEEEVEHDIAEAIQARRTSAR
jgi:hypothetical protein